MPSMPNAPYPHHGAGNPRCFATGPLRVIKRARIGPAVGEEFPVQHARALDDEALHRGVCRTSSRKRPARTSAGNVHGPGVTDRHRRAAGSTSISFVADELAVTLALQRARTIVIAFAVTGGSTSPGANGWRR